MARLVRPDPEDLAWWRARLVGLSAPELARVEPHLRMRRLAPGERLLRAGDPAREVAIVRRGVLQEMFELESGEQRTRSFATDGEATGSLSDLLRGGEARSSIVACTE